MDAGRQTNKNSSRKSDQNDLASVQQQLALAAQLGMVPGMMDPAALAAGANVSDIDLQRLLTMQAGSLPFLNPGAALHGFGGLPIPGLAPSLMMPGNMGAGGSDWLAMAQQAQLLASLGGAVPSPMLSQMYGSNSLSGSGGTSGESSKAGLYNVKADHSRSTRSPGQGSKVSSRPSSNASSSRLTPSGVLSPTPSTSGRPSSKPHSSTPNSSSKETKLHENLEKRSKKANNAEQLLQTEMLRQFEQQLLLQQMQMKQQEQLEATMKAMNLPQQQHQRGGSKQRQSNNVQSEKLQERISQSIYQQLLASNSFLPGVPPGINSYFATQQLMDQMLSLDQSSNNLKSKSSKEKHFSSLPNHTVSSTTRDVEKQGQSSRPTNHHTTTNKRSSFPSNDATNPFISTGDVNTDFYLANLYNQLQKQSGSNIKVEKTDKSAVYNNNQTSSDKKTSATLPQQQPKNPSELKDTSGALNLEVASHRRKQANPTPIGNNSVPASTTNNNSLHNAKPSSEGEKSFVGDKLSASSSNPKDLSLSPKSSSNKTTSFDSNIRNNLLNSDESKSKKIFSKSSQKPEDSLNEKDIILAMQAMTEKQNNTGSTSSGDQVDQLLLSVYKKFLKSGENLDINKMNELLTATVAAEMKRLQVQQVNLTRELQMLNKNEHSSKQSTSTRENSSSSSSHQDVKYPRKRRRIISDEDEVMEPLRQGWKREVKCRRVGNQVRGEVFYHTPEGRKLRTYPDVLKYLEDRNIKTLHRNNFSFSSRLKIGTFYEQKGDSKQWTKIPEQEIDRHLGSFEHDDSSHSTSASDDNQPGLSSSKHKRQANSTSNNLFLQQVIEEKLRKDEENEAAKLADAEMRMQQNEQKKLARLQREIKEKQMIEERRKLEAARQLAKYQEAIRKEKEREERRRHLEFIKIMETKRRAEERDKRKEEMKNERIYIREKKMQQRRLAMKLARELKMPVEDMCLNNHIPLPKMKCLQRSSDADKTQLNGESTADVLMVLEFLFTFKDAISIDEDIIPTFEELQRGLLNDPDHVETLVRLTMALLHQCLCDPGVPAPGPWLHCLIGVKVTDLDVSKENYSEILRLFLWARNGTKTEITDLLETEPFPSLSTDHKAAILASLVNELVCSKPVCDQIDKHLDNLATLRRDKWIVEGKIRQARIEHANDESDSASVNSPAKPRSKTKQKNDDDEDDKNEKEDSCKDDDSVTSDNKPTCRSDTRMERKMKILTKEHQSFNERLFSSSKPLRSLEMGQDRYKRRYWLLSHLGGIYVEGLESGSWYDNDTFPEEEEEEILNKEEKNESNPVSNNSNDKDPKSATPDLTPSSQQISSSDLISSQNKSEKENSARLPDISDTSKQTIPATSSNITVSQPTPDSLASTCVHNLTKCPGASLPNSTPVSSDALVLSTLNDAVVNSNVTSQGEVVTAATLCNSTSSTQQQPIMSPTTITTLNHVTVTDASASNACISTSQSRGLTKPLPVSRDESLPLVNKHLTTVESNMSLKKKDEVSLQKLDFKEEDEVEAAAKAIAAKAVAASSHLLYPQPKLSVPSPAASKPSTIHKNAEEDSKTSLNINKNKTSIITQSDEDATLRNLGKHVTETLRSMGANIHQLSDEQIQTLIHISKTNPDDFKCNNTIKNTSSSTASFTSVSHSSRNTTMTSALPYEDTPIDLSKPSSNFPPKQTPSSSSFSSSVMRSIKAEPFSFDSAFNMTSLPYFGGAMMSHLNSMIKSEPDKVMSPELAEVKANDVNKEPTLIPEEMKQGWWKISSVEEFEELCRSLHCRGIREKHLHRSATKHRNYCLNAIEQANAPEFQFINSSKKEKDDQLDTDSKNNENETKKKEEEGGDDKLSLDASMETSLQTDVEMIKQIESLIDRCVVAGIMKDNTETFSKWSEQCHQLSHVPHQLTDDDEARYDWLNPIEHDPKSTIGFAVELLRKLEDSVLRGYLKPPLVRKGGSSEFSNLPSLSDSGALDVAAGLKTWRNAVATATSAAQLSMCATMFDSCVNWQHAPHALSKVEASPKNKKKRSGGKTPGSGSGKKKKKMSESVVDSEDSMSGSRLLSDTNEDKSSEVDIKMDENSCDVSNTYPIYQDEDSSMHLDDQSEMSDKERSNADHSSLSGEEKPTPTALSNEKVKKKRNKDKKPRKKKKTLAGMCKEILRHLQSQEKATWFLFPVDLKAVPDYKKIIKKPMDFNTIESRLRRKKYKFATQFADDVRTIFDNCRIFNEDESPIGQAGHTLRAIFESKWTNLESNMNLQDPIS